MDVNTTVVAALAVLHFAVMAIGFATPSPEDGAPFAAFGSSGLLTLGLLWLSSHLTWTWA